MVYVEFLRARRALTWHVGILAVITLALLYFGHETNVDINGGSTFLPGMPIPLGQLAPIAMFFSAVYASSAGTSLNRENLTRDLSWTKPQSRTLVALQFILVDLAGVAIAFAVTMLAVAAVLVRMHFVPAIDPQFGPFMALGVGVGLMWYALLQMITCTFGPGARSLGGILWPIAFVALGVADVPGPLGIAARALDVINPLAYMEGFSSTSAHTTTLHTNSLWQFPVEERALIVWFFTVLFCAIAIAIWPRKEA